MSDTPRAKLSAKHPRPAERTRAPVRPGGIGAVQRRRPSETAAQNTAPNTAPTTPARNTWYFLTVDYTAGHSIEGDSNVPHTE